MNDSRGLLTFSFTLGNALGARWRLSFLLPVVWLAAFWRLQDVVSGVLAGAVILLSLVLHELGQLVGTSISRGRVDEVVLWPLGSLTHHHSGPGIRGIVGSNLVGPLLNLLVAAMCLTFVPDRETALALFNPFAGFQVPADESIRLTAVRMFVFANWCLALFNLLPVLPLDFGRVVHQFLNLRFTLAESRDLMLRSGLVLCVFGMLAGFVFDLSSVTALFAFLLILHIHETIQIPPMPDRTPTAEEETFLGYDFSEGYSSLARSAARYEDEEEGFFGAPEFSPDDEWEPAEDSGRRERSEQAATDERELDAALKKLHESGKEALSPGELRILKQASARFRDRQARDV